MTPVGGTPEMISVVISLTVIMAFLLGVAYVARRWRVGGRTRKESRSGAIRIVAARAVGWQSSLQIVEAEGQRFLVAAGRGGITAIGRLTGTGSGFPEPLDAPGPSDPQTRSER